MDKITKKEATEIVNDFVASLKFRKSVVALKKTAIDRLISLVMYDEARIEDGRIIYVLDEKCGDIEEVMFRNKLYSVDDIAKLGDSENPVDRAFEMVACFVEPAIPASYFKDKGQCFVDMEKIASLFLPA